MIRPRAPALRRRQVSWIIRQRLTRLLTCSAHAATRNASIGSLLAAHESSASGLAGWHDDLDLVEHECQEAQILEQTTARR